MLPIKDWTLADEIYRVPQNPIAVIELKFGADWKIPRVDDVVCAAVRRPRLYRFLVLFGPLAMFLQHMCYLYRCRRSKSKL